MFHQDFQTSRLWLKKGGEAELFNRLRGIWIADEPSDVHANFYLHCSIWGGGRGGGVHPLPWVFAMLQYLGNILPLIDSLSYEKYTLFIPNHRHAYDFPQFVKT